ncbi:MAG: GGDEF domain-containing protein [Treponema sp.]|nr:GGDEF domain-containing protein [Treponema sp.]
MKNLAVFIDSLTIEYSLDVLNGISDFFTDKDISVFIAQTKEPHEKNGLFEYQNWSSAELLFSKQIDAYIVITGSYSSLMTSKELSNALEKIGDRPVVSIGMPLDLPNSYLIKTECNSAYDEIVFHLKNYHNCKKFAFMSANDTGSEEALERFQAFKNGLKNNELDFDPSLVLDGGFLKSKSYKAFKEKYKSKKNINFDCIICANDLMALGVTTALKEMDVKIPEEVKIIGFDETSLATSSRPKLSTVDQNIEEQGYESARLIYDLLMGKEVERVKSIPVTPIYRQSCGCISLDNYDEVFCDKEGNILHKTQKQEELTKNRNGYFNFLSGINNIETLFDFSRSALTLRKCFFSMQFMMKTANIESLAVLFFESPLILQKEDDITIPKKTNLCMYISKDNKEELFEPGLNCDSCNQLLPDPLLNSTKGKYLLLPIFSGEVLYGYTICKPEGKDFSIYSIYLKIIINTLAQAYEYTKSFYENQKLSEENLKLQQNNSSLYTQSKTDELTKVLNRRGFMELGQKSINLEKEKDSKGLVIFFDMDGLKEINDNYGHEMGDKAIKAMAEVISKALRASDIVGRIGGDEFGAVVNGANKKQETSIRKKLNQLCKSISKENKFPFLLSCSMGVTEFNSSTFLLSDLLSKSDTLLYNEKRIKHAKKKSASI